MTDIEISTLEHASRTSIAWVPEGYDGQTHFPAVLAAIVPAMLIIAFTASLLFFLA